MTAFLLRYSLRPLSTVVSVFVLSFFLSAAPAQAAQAGETITFDGSNPGMLGTAPPWSLLNSLFPAGSLTGNKVTVTGGVIPGIVFGGLSDSGNVYGNSVHISGGSVGEDIYGAYSNSGNAFGNSISISGGFVGGNIFSGYSDSGNASDNHISITGGTVDGIVMGGLSESGDAYGNSVSITGGSVKGVFGGTSTNGAAFGNSVSIMGGSVGGNILGGSGDINVIYNTVTIGREASIADTSLLFGGSALPGADAFTGNTLNMLGWQGTVKRVAGFQTYNFMLPADITSGETMLTSTSAHLTDDATRSSVVNVGIMGGGRVQQVGDSFTLIDASAGILIANADLNPTAQGVKGLSLLYDFNLDNVSVPNTLIATISGVRASPQAKALAEGRASGMAFVNQGADLAAGQGMNSALAATGAGGLANFTAISAGSSRYNTGSHVDVDGFSLMTGLGWRAPASTGNLLLGAFFEAGWGNYDSHNSFSNAASVKGSGDTEYYGGGFLGRYELTEGTLKGLYTEASLRAGWATTDFSSSDLQDFFGPIHTSYDSGAAYYGAQAGLGYIWQFNDAASLDFSTKYLWTHQNSDSVTVTGDPITFKAADSQRWRNGARFNYAVSTESGAQFTPYIGAAYEHEFDGKARATAYGYSIKSPNLEGGTGIGELGVSFKPAAESAFSADLGVQGYTGVREGVTGNFQLKYEF